MNRSDIWSNIKGIVRIKIGRKHYQTVDPPPPPTPREREPQVGRGLVGVYLLLLHFKFQFSKSIKSSTFYISLNLTYPLRNISLSQNAQKFTKNRQTVVNEISIGILALLETWSRYWQKGRVKRRQNSFTCTPALNRSLSENSSCKREGCFDFTEKHIKGLRAISGWRKLLQWESLKNTTNPQDKTQKSLGRRSWAKKKCFAVLNSGLQKNFGRGNFQNFSSRFSYQRNNKSHITSIGENIHLLYR